MPTFPIILENPMLLLAKSFFTLWEFLKALLLSFISFNFPIIFLFFCLALVISFCVCFLVIGNCLETCRHAFYVSSMIYFWVEIIWYVGMPYSSKRCLPWSTRGFKFVVDAVYEFVMIVLIDCWVGICCWLDREDC